MLFHIDKVWYAIYDYFIDIRLAVLHFH